MVITLPHPLLVTAEAQLLDELLRLAAAGGAAVRVAPDATAARASWVDAPFVVIGEDQARECALAGLTPRDHVTLAVREGGVEAAWPSATALRAEQVVELPRAQGWLVDRFTEFAAGVAHPAQAARVLAVIGGRGGAGASVLATALAVTARRGGLDTLLVDADPFGGGVDLMLGWERVRGLRWPELVEASGIVDPPALVTALPGEGRLAVLSFDQSALDTVPVEAMAATLQAGRRGRDLVVVDLPRFLDDAGRLALGAADHAYLVVPAELRATAAARRVVTAVGPHCRELSVIVRGPTPIGVDPGEVARSLHLPLVGVLRPEPRLLGQLEAGQAPASSGRGPLADLCRHLLADLLPARREVRPHGGRSR